MPGITTHPSQEQLSAYNLGQLPPHEAVAIETHISDCEPCCDTIVALSTDNTFIGLLKEAREITLDQPTDSESISASPPSTSMDIPAPLVDHPRYEIVRLIGRGGMGDVYEARHRKMERKVALKVINRNLFHKSAVVNRFHREVKTAAQLSHPNIVTSYDADQAGDYHFMVMEYVDGVDLSCVVKSRGALPIHEACDYIRQAAIGLQHAHERGMVHRDVKPHNLMLTSNGVVKILDFGLASLTPESVADVDHGEVRSELTIAGSIMGTPDYISPEQAQDAHQADHRSDIYSLGATLFNLLADRAPVAGKNVAEKLKNLAESEPDSLASLRRGIPTELVSVVDRMMAKDPADRFQSAEEVAAALLPFSSAAETTDASQLQKKVGTDRRKPPIKLLMAVAALFFATLAATVFYIQTNNGVVRVEVLNDDIEVAVKNQTITIQQHNNQSITISPGQQELVVRQKGSDLVLETSHFQVRRGDEIAFKVDLLEGEVVVRQVDESTSRAQSLVGKWRGMIGGADEELRVAFHSDGSFELKISDPQEVMVNAIGTYRTDFSVAPAHLDLDATILQGPSPGSGSRNDTPSGETPTEIKPQRKRPVQHKIQAIIELVDANTLRLSDLDADTRPQSFGGNTFVLRRQGAANTSSALDRVPSAEVPPSDNAAAEHKDGLDRSVRVSTLELSDDVMRNFIKSRGHFENFERDLYATISSSAGIPNDQWEKFASTANASVDAIKGTPLSLVMLMQKASDDEDAAIRILTDQPAPMRDIQRAMSPSQPNGYVSLIQPQYITKTKLGFDRESTEFRGTAWFEVPGLYAGKFDFTMFYHEGKMKVTRFALPELGIELVPNNKGEWIQSATPANADDATNLKDFELKTKLSPQEVQAAIRAYYVHKYPLFAASVNQRANIVNNLEKLGDRETRRQIGELAVNSPVSEAINSFPGHAAVTFSEATRLSKDEALITRVNLHAGIDNTCRIHVSRHPRKFLKPNETYAISEPISETELRELIGSKETSAHDPVDLPQQVFAPEANSLVWIDAAGITWDQVDRSLTSLIDAAGREDQEKAEAWITQARNQSQAMFATWEQGVEAGLETIVIAGKPKYAEVAGEDTEELVKAQMEGAEQGQLFVRMRPGSKPDQAMEIIAAAFMKLAQIEPGSKDAKEFIKAKPTGFVEVGDGWFVATGEYMLPLPAKTEALDTTQFAQMLGKHHGAAIRYAQLTTEAARFEMDMDQLDAGALFFGGLMTSLREMKSTSGGVWLGDEPKVVLDIKFATEEDALQFNAKLEEMVNVMGLILAYGTQNASDPEEAAKMEETKAVLRLFFPNRQGPTISKTFDISLLKRLAAKGWPWTDFFVAEESEEAEEKEEEEEESPEPAINDDGVPQNNTDTQRLQGP